MRRSMNARFRTGAVASILALLVVGLPAPAHAWGDAASCDLPRSTTVQHTNRFSPHPFIGHHMDVNFKACIFHPVKESNPDYYLTWTMKPKVTFPGILGLALLEVVSVKTAPYVEDVKYFTWTNGKTYPLQVIYRWQVKVCPIANTGLCDTHDFRGYVTADLTQMRFVGGVWDDAKYW